MILDVVGPPAVGLLSALCSVLLFIPQAEGDSCGAMHGAEPYRLFDHHLHPQRSMGAASDPSG